MGRREFPQSRSTSPPRVTRSVSWSQCPYNILAATRAEEGLKSMKLVAQILDPAHLAFQITSKSTTPEAEFFEMIGKLRDEPAAPLSAAFAIFGSQRQALLALPEYERLILPISLTTVEMLNQASYLFLKLRKVAQFIQEPEVWLRQIQNIYF